MSNKITVYHGSSQIIKKPIYGAGNLNNDYGLGFYCTESMELAKEWACSVDTDGYANKYTLDMNGLSVLSLTNGECNILNWLFVLLENRKFKLIGDVAKQAKEYIFDNFAIDYKGYDIIKGYRADDSYFSFAKVSLKCKSSSFITSCNLSLQLNLSEPLQIPCPIRNGKFLTFLLPCISILSNN